MNSQFSDIVVSRQSVGVQLITLNRPEALNSLRSKCLVEIAQAIQAADEDDGVKVVVITGGPKVFAAGADIKEMAQMGPIEILHDERPQHWAALRRFRKPLIAAVNGYALGGGCELAMQADIVIAGSDAKFGQPEINLGIIPGGGGTQRLVRAVGKSLAMKMILSGEMITANTAFAAGLIAEITQPELCLERALELARTIAAKPPLAVRLAKESVLKAFETTLESGLDVERKVFTVLAASEDRDEGLSAFIEKRKPSFKGR